MEGLFSLPPNIAPEEKEPAVGGVVVWFAVPEGGVEVLVFPNRLVDCAGFAPPPKRFEVGVWELLPNNPPVAPDDPGVLLVGVVPSAGLAALLKSPPPEVPGGAVGVVVEGLVPPPRFPKEKLEPAAGGLLKRLVEFVGVDEPNKPPVEGALDVVALLDWPPELALPKIDIVYYAVYDIGNIRVLECKDVCV